MTSVAAEPDKCPKCGSTLLSINEDGDYEYLCGKVIYNRLPAQVISTRTAVPAKATSITEISREGPKDTETYFDQHRDEILADRLSIGNAKAMVKWNLSYPVWTELKRKWRKEGIVVQDLRRLPRRLSSTEAKEDVAVSQKKDTSPRELEQYELGATRDGFHAVLEKVAEPIKNIDKGRVSRKNVVPDVEKLSKVRLIFRWLVSEGIEPSYEMADELLGKYIKEEPGETTRELVGNKEFGVVYLRKGMFRIYLEELLNSMPEFKKTREGEYQYDKDGKRGWARVISIAKERAEKFRVYCQKYYQEHREELLAKNLKYNQEHREERKVYARKYAREHREEKQTYRRQYYQEHKKELLTRMHEYYRRHKEEIRVYNRKYHLEYTYRKMEQKGSFDDIHHRL